MTAWQRMTSTVLGVLGAASSAGFVLLGSAMVRGSSVQFNPRYPSLTGSLGRSLPETERMLPSAAPSRPIVIEHETLTVIVRSARPRRAR